MGGGIMIIPPPDFVFGTHSPLSRARGSNLRLLPDIDAAEPKPGVRRQSTVTKENLEPSEDGCYIDAEDNPKGGKW